MNYWLFTCNPLLYPQVFEELEGNSITRWMVTSHKSLVQVGDKVAFWIGGKNDPGIYMFAEVASLPYEDKHFRKAGMRAFYVKLGTKNTFPETPIGMETLLEDPSMNRIIKRVRQPHMGPIKLSKSNWVYMNKRAKKAVRDFARREHKKSRGTSDGSAAREQKRIERDYSLRPTQKKALILSRVGQGSFRRDLLRKEKACRITGISDKRLLIASHIKPWSESTDREKLDPNNGLLLSPNLDKVFDEGLITFNSAGKLLISKDISQQNLRKLGISTNANIGPLNISQKRYMKYHRERIFRI
jgi:hypothetical protein